MAILTAISFREKKFLIVFLDGDFFLKLHVFVICPKTVGLFFFSHVTPKFNHLQHNNASFGWVTFYHRPKRF